MNCILLGNAPKKIKKINNLGLKLGVKIIYYGKISEDLIKLYARSKVLCLPSLFEGVGLVALEAACYGAKIAITQIGGLEITSKKMLFILKNQKELIKLKS